MRRRVWAPTLVTAVVAGSMSPAVAGPATGTEAGSAPGVRAGAVPPPDKKG
ncbi:hypothetical protein [Streptomyces sp. NPDC050504]|uniref:hypothetical protein n=1 Tax=Streptomyces sp. NPDC050504 TaxID=3365618 RepID=UPI00379E565A